MGPVLQTGVTPTNVTATPNTLERPCLGIGVPQSAFLCDESTDTRQRAFDSPRHRVGFEPTSPTYAAGAMPLDQRSLFGGTVRERSEFGGLKDRCITLMLQSHDFENFMVCGSP